MFVIISVIYRPIEQLLSRTIAERRARGTPSTPLRVPIADPGGFALVFLIVALALHGELSTTSSTTTRLSTTCSSWARWHTRRATSRAAGWPGTSASRLFGGLVLMESTSRISFAIAVALGIASGQTAVALGIAAAPFVSLVVVPAAFARSRKQRARRAAARGRPRRCEAPGRAALATGRSRSTRPTRRWRGRGPRACRRPAAHDELSLRRGGGFAVWVSSIMLSEQTLLNAAVLTVDATSHDKRARGHRVQRAADRARAAAAVPGDPDLAAAPPDRPRGDEGTRRSRARSA
jgi:hypothetical protein